LFFLPKYRRAAADFNVGQNPFADRLPQHRIHSVASLLDADVRKAEKLERLRFSFSTLLPVLDRERTKFQQPRFLGMQLQVELPHSFSEFRSKLIGIRFAVKQPRCRQQSRVERVQRLMLAASWPEPIRKPRKSV
jgi:hypothetical protein